MLQILIIPYYCSTETRRTTVVTDSDDGPHIRVTDQLPSAETLKSYAPNTALRWLVLQDIAILTLAGLAILFAPKTVAWLSNLIFSGALKSPSALVIKSDTSLLLLKTVGATQLAFAWSHLWRMYKRNDTDAGWSLWCVFIVSTWFY